MAPNTDKYTFVAPLIVGNMPTIDGNIYPMELLYQLVERFTLKPSIIIQEMNLVERKARGIPIAEPWDKKIMGIIKSGKVVNNTLFIECECKKGREGDKLAGLVKNLTVQQLEFYPVGYGVVDANGMISPNYKLNYVSVEPKRI